MYQHDSELQSYKYDAEDLSYLYEFICECPNPTISDAIKRVVDHWLQTVDSVPQFSEAMRTKLQSTDQELVQICWVLSLNPNTPPSILADLCVGANSSLLERIAQNSQAGASTLAQLSYQAVAEIRIAAASNPNTPIAAILMLIEDDNPDIRFSIAEDPHVPAEALEALTRDDNPYVKMRAEKTLARARIESDILSAR